MISYDFHKQRNNIMYFFSNMGINTNINKIKFMTIKTKMIFNGNFIYVL